MCVCVCVCVCVKLDVFPSAKSRDCDGFREKGDERNTTYINPCVYACKVACVRDKGTKLCNHEGEHRQFLRDTIFIFRVNILIYDSILTYLLTYPMVQNPS